MNLKHLSDLSLLTNTEKLAREERELLTQVLHHLREIERRRLFSSQGYKSLFDYCVKKLGYSEAEALRRIRAMRLMAEIPEIEVKIESGTLTLTNISAAQNLFRREPKTPEQKVEVLKQIENASTREAEKTILALSTDPVALRPDTVRLVSYSKIEYRFVADEALAARLAQVKGLLAHKGVGDEMGKLVAYLCEIALEKFLPKGSKADSFADLQSSSHKPFTIQTNAAPLPLAQRKHRVSDDRANPDRKESIRRNRIDGDTKPKEISARLRDEIWIRADNKCEKCGSQHALQIDHIKPKAKGGSNDPDNLRLLCRNCNQRAAIEEFGADQMELYLEN